MEAKIATCCYCGARATLVMDKGRHELACSSCGAPLHDLKRLRSNAVNHGTTQARPSGTKRPKRDKHKPADHRKHTDMDRRRKSKKPKKRKSFGAKLFEEAFDIIEDIFD